MAKTPKYSGLKSARQKPDKSKPPLEKAEVLRFITENPNLASKREIARAFNVKGGERPLLKEILRQMVDEGLLNKVGKKTMRPDMMPSVTTLDIASHNDDGDLIARPSQWRDGHGNAPAVVIRQMPQKSVSGKAHTGKVHRRNNTSILNPGDRVLARIFSNSKHEKSPPPGKIMPAYTGKVIKILDRRTLKTTGIFRLNEDLRIDHQRDGIQNSGARVLPINKRGKEYIIANDLINGARDGDLVEIEPLYSNRTGLPQAKIINIITAITSEKAMSMIAIHDHDIPHIFPLDVIKEAKNTKEAILEKREDWRDLPLITIDPANAKDHDDAVYATMDENPENIGGVIIYIAIADVAYYVQPDSPMDIEARRRGNSVYFPDCVIPMLPEQISNNLCSLKEGVDRPALAVKITFNIKGHKISHSFHRIMMRSAASLTYQQAQNAIDGHPDHKTSKILTNVLKPLWAAYKILKKGRNQRKPLELDLPERRIIVDENGKVDRVDIPDRLDAHKLIEECMIQANVAAASALESKQQALIYRIHEAPSQSKQEVLREFLATLGIPLAKNSRLQAEHFNTILALVKDKSVEMMVNEMVLRTQSQAAYHPDNQGHFGLSLDRYAHFTSPIRRYADLIVHRALIGSHKLGTGGITPDEEASLETIANEISNFERRASSAERDTQDRLIAHHLAQHIGHHFQGRIAGVIKSGLFVSLPEYGADGFIPVATLGTDYFIYDEAQQALIGQRTRAGYRLGDKVDISLAKAVPLAGSLQFEMLSKGTKISSDMRSFHKNKRGHVKIETKSKSRQRK